MSVEGQLNVKEEGNSEDAIHINNSAAYASLKYKL